ncbi:putative nicotinate-nucleotide adenylyltransferase [mine drainage metagenome]|jgi:nicotinate-nucleotide adenylyltransferase|uniref:Putative nicotinate-nucleotide adenylyltransferase n=1 Tax=mine drainage metagenome TaxID=410659 RepID=A0A1J5PM68_9ZZZZ
MTTPAARIGLLGGSFDPPHRAHLELARSALRALPLDAVWLIPAGQPWQRAPLQADAAQRRQMLELLIAGEPGLDVCSVELERAGPSYTIDTVRELQSRHPDCAFTLIVGADQLANLTSWRDWTRIAAAVDLAAAPRPGHPLRAPAALADALARAGHALHALPMTPMPLSATAARAAHGEALHALVPEPVARYIEHHHLYSTDRKLHGHS